MHLAELIPAETTLPHLLDNLETWLTSRMGKGVVRAKDTPNFIANRIGVFSLLAILHHAEAMQLEFDEVDALTGALLGRPKSATFRTMDVVGLDTMHHVVQTMTDQLKNDPWHALFKLPAWLMRLIKEGHLGQKTGQGIYRKKGQVIEVFDSATGEYRPAKGEVSQELITIMKIADPAQRMQALIAANNKQAKFLTACYRDLFHYCAYHLAEIANTVRDIDLAIRWGFGWQQGPFETWQSAGLEKMLAPIKAGIAAKESLSQAALPQWLSKIDHFYSKEGAYSPQKNSYSPRSQLPVYHRQFFPDRVLEESPFSRKREKVPEGRMRVSQSGTYEQNVLWENEGIRLWYLKDDVAVVNFKSKANTIGQTVLEGLEEAVERAEKECKGMIIYQTDATNFSSGADLKVIAQLLQTNKMQAVDEMVGQFQRVIMRVKYAAIPVVAALRGRALGGGCELIMHCAAIVAAFESYPGLVEIGVGLLPAGGGCKEMTMRAACQANDADLLAFIQPYFQQIATAAVAGSAPEAKQLGYLRNKDCWLMHSNEVLFAALAKIESLQAANYQAPLKTRFKVAGREGHARLQAGLVNWLSGGFISQHDYFLANEIAKVMCGGDVNEGELVDEHWLLHLEKQAFLTMAATSLSQARIVHLLETGKPLRN